MYPMPWEFPSKLFILQNGGKWGHRHYFFEVNPEQRETIIQFINFNSWNLEEMLFKKGSVCQDTYCDDQGPESWNRLNF